MVQRSKRSLSPGKVEEMQKEVREFQWKVSTWSSQIPIGSAVYIALDPLHHSLDLVSRLLNAEKDSRALSGDVLRAD
jgi:hypothetical protein